MTRERFINCEIIALLVFVQATLEFKQIENSFKSMLLGLNKVQRLIKFFNTYFSICLEKN